MTRLQSPAITAAIREAAGMIARDYGMESTPGEVSDMACDLLCEETVLMTEQEASEVEAEVVRETLWLFGFDGGASDASPIPLEKLREVSSGHSCKCAGCLEGRHCGIGWGDGRCSVSSDA